MDRTEVFSNGHEEEERKTDHLSREMTVLSDKYCNVLHDNLHGCKAFEAMPHQPIEVYPDVPPVFRTHVRTTPIHQKESSKGFIKQL